MSLPVDTFGMEDASTLSCPANAIFRQVLVSVLIIRPFIFADEKVMMTSIFRAQYPCTSMCSLAKL
jgi:hypothetical protein